MEAALAWSKNRMRGDTVENRGEPIGYTCYFCLIDFETKKDHNAGKKDHQCIKIKS